MADLTYGTPQFYAEHFSDFLADVQADDPKYGDAIVEGLLLCIKDWRDYHANQVNEYDRIEQRVRQTFTV